MNWGYFERTHSILHGLSIKSKTKISHFTFLERRNTLDCWVKCCFGSKFVFFVRLYCFVFFKLTAVSSALFGILHFSNNSFLCFFFIWMSVYASYSHISTYEIRRANIALKLISRVYFDAIKFYLACMCAMDFIIFINFWCKH